MLYRIVVLFVIACFSVSMAAEETLLTDSQTFSLEVSQVIHPLLSLNKPTFFSRAGYPLGTESCCTMRMYGGYLFRLIVCRQSKEFLERKITYGDYSGGRIFVTQRASDAIPFSPLTVTKHTFFPFYEGERIRAFIDYPNTDPVINRFFFFIAMRLTYRMNCNKFLNDNEFLDNSLFVSNSIKQGFVIPQRRSMTKYERIEQWTKLLRGTNDIERVNALCLLLDSDVKQDMTLLEFLENRKHIEDSEDLMLDVTNAIIDDRESQ